MVLAPTRRKLRKAITAVNEVMAQLRVLQHPEKTFIGRIARGFDFLGYWFRPWGWQLPGRRWIGARKKCPGFRSKVRTSFASGRISGGGWRGCEAVFAGWRRDGRVSSMNCTARCSVRACQIPNKSILMPDPTGPLVSRSDHKKFNARRIVVWPVKGNNF